MRQTRKHIISTLMVETQKKNETREDFITRIINERSGFLKKYLSYAKAEGYVLGLSGGVDSFVASALVKHAGLNLLSIALPYGKQYDIEDTNKCVKILNPYRFIVHNIKDAVDSQFNILDVENMSVEKINLLKGNIMARERMSVQYSYGYMYNYLVIGTDHATEAITGFYTKFGDGACDITPLSGLTKDVIYEIAKRFSAPNSILEKAPSAGLWEGQTDENELGISYQSICNYLNKKDVSQEEEIKLENIYAKTEHKRHLPVTIKDTWWKSKNIDLLIIDCQNDFISGSLACINAENAIDSIVKYINNNHKNFSNIHFSLDSHPYNHCSFVENGGVFPSHCVTGTEGYELHHKIQEKLKSVDILFKSIKYYKGLSIDVEEFSAYNAVTTRFDKFTKSTLNECLERNVIVCGIATEYCVKETVLDLLNNGFNVTVLKDCLAYVNEEEHFKALKEMEEKGAKLI